VRGRLGSHWDLPCGHICDHGPAKHLPPCLASAISSVISTMIGGLAFKAPRKAKWPPSVKCVTPTTWHSGGLLSSFNIGVAVATINVRSHANWVRRALHHIELMTAFEIPSNTHSTFPLDLCNQVCALLPTLSPLGVLRLLLSLLVPVKGRSFMGGRSPLEKLHSRQKVAAS
jgi:hypothetical protein